MCACTEPVRTGIGAVCVEYGLPKSAITMVNHTHIAGTEECFVFYFWHPMLVRPVMKRLFFPWKTKERASLARLMMIRNIVFVVFWGALLRPTAGAVVLFPICTTL